MDNSSSSRSNTSVATQEKQKHVAFAVDSHRRHVYIAPDHGGTDNIEVKTRKAQLWINVIEGIGFPAHLRETHVSVTLGEHHVSGKHASHDSDHPKWGETFLLGRCDEEAEVIIDVRATHLVQCSTLMSVKVPVEEILNRGEIFQWWTATEECKGTPTAPAILIHLRVICPDTVVSHTRLSSLRIEMVSDRVQPGGTLRGCIVYNANRSRHFTKASLSLRHRAKSVTHTKEDDVDDAASSSDIFFVQTPLPHEFDPQLTPGETHSSFHVKSGVYYWPFQIALPTQMEPTGLRQVGDVQENVTFALDVAFKMRGGKEKHKNFPIVVEPLQKKTDEASTLPKIKFFSRGPFTPDRCDIMSPTPSSNRKRSHGTVDCRVKIPSAGCCSSVNRALYCFGHLVPAVGLAPNAK